MDRLSVKEDRGQGRVDAHRVLPRSCCSPTRASTGSSAAVAVGNQEARHDVSLMENRAKPNVIILWGHSLGIQMCKGICEANSDYTHAFFADAPVLIELTIKSASDGGFEFLFSCLS